MLQLMIATKIAKNPILRLPLIHAMIIVPPKRGAMHALWTATHVLELILHANRIALSQGILNLIFGSVVSAAAATFHAIRMKRCIAREPTVVAFYHKHVIFLYWKLFN